MEGDAVREALRAFEDNLSAEHGMRVARVLAELTGETFDPLLTTRQAAALAGMEWSAWRKSHHVGLSTTPPADEERAMPSGRTQAMWRWSTVVAWRRRRELGRVGVDS